MTFPPLQPGQTPPRVLTIAGSDSGGGAGLQADLRTFALAGCHGMTAVTAVTVQNTLGVTGVAEIPADVVAAQIRSVAGDIGVQAAKTGMLASASIVSAVAAACRDVGIGEGAGRDGRGVPFVVDPVCASMHGNPLLTPDALDVVRDELFPLATVVTPNLDEVALLVGIEVTGRASAEEAARRLVGLGARWALVTGGHLRSDPLSVDILYDGDSFLEFAKPRIPTGNDHGGGDTLASSMTCALARGASVPEAVAFAKDWVTESLRWSYDLGAGHGPVNPLWRLG
ncbi:MAG: bifunctional hydroxymethylpyrimidine kinase/phosphomethylpyrimidine kinase [Segniliparus sp.]|uniref:bifunctional hydroxymethylpyrimidine kinase/phosphomethylpyrimidine kinase n=1 Tax=Segniliparus sp. TaxID=2804064 RepID=UPI003F2BA4E0